MLARVRIINSLLVGKRYPKIQDIIEKCKEYGIKASERTIQKDLQDMRSGEALGYDAPIIFDREKGGYVYSIDNYSIDKLPFNEIEIEALLLSVNFIRRFKDSNIFSNYAGAIDKISTMLKVSRMETQARNLSFVDFENHPPAPGFNYLDELISFIKDKKVISVSYQKYSEEKSTDYIIHPVYIKEYKGFWYLIGMKDRENIFITMALDRIREIIPVRAIKYNPMPFNPADYYRHTVGIRVERGAKPVRVVLSFLNGMGKYLLAQPIHSTQTLVSQTKNIMNFEFMIVINPEFKSEILRWLPDVIVMEPENLKKEILRMLEAGIGVNRE